MASTTNRSGSVVALWRYPVKSMQGEELNATEVTERGLLGDRAYALLDAETGKVVSAKNPHKWPNLFAFRAAFTAPPRAGQPLPPVQITLPDGSILAGVAGQADEPLSKATGRAVHLTDKAPDKRVLEEYWLNIEGLPNRDKVTDWDGIPPGLFFDAATILLLTTGTIDRLRQLYPQGRFEVRRFRPNVVIETEGAGFIENDWVGRTLALGDQVRVEVTGPCPRCVMTTLPQSDLPRDPGILRTAVQNNNGHIGVYGRIAQGGQLRRGDAVRLV